MMRVVPIVLEGGRVIENRGEEINKINVEYEETFTEDFDQKAERKRATEMNDRKVELTSKEKGLTIPIKISNGNSIVSVIVYQMTMINFSSSE